MKKILYTGIAACLFFIAGCQNDRVAEWSETTFGQDLESRSGGDVVTPMGMAYPGQMIVKLNESAVNKMSIEQFGDVQLQSVPSQMSTALSSIKAKKMCRLFPPAGKYEARSRKAGMHLWYIVNFDEGVNLTKALNRMATVPGVESVEFIPVIEMMGIDNPADLLNKPSLYNNFQRTDEMPFNDPLLKQQWHYNNIGKVNGGVMGADINLFKAWKINSGSDNVIVCVVDGGIDVTHEDLKDNLWVNEAELNGISGKDDDGNGFIDDINGFCFVANRGDVLPDGDAHGTHVSGTVAAKNNNGIGVAGVAGGDGTINSGIRLQSAAIFRSGYESGGNGAAAIKYGADNGAVISQNSWGYPLASGLDKLPGSLKAAIDYFTDYAGTDENGNQRPDSPMKGGLVFFAAGNDDAEYLSQPAAYERVIAVSAMGPDFKKASYATYGDWVDITAPGGDQDRFGTSAGVLSTLAPKIVVSGDSYGFYQGTSMACPHVSGVAALVVSQFGGPGFTNEDLRERILSTVMPLDIDAQNPTYAGKLGRGYLDAYLALTLENKKMTPEKPKFDDVKIADGDFTSITLYWKVPADGDDGAASRYKLYFSKEQLTSTNYQEKGTLLGSMSGYISGVGLSVGEEMSFFIGDLLPDTEYYFVLVAYDRWGLSSEPSIHSFRTKKNHAPEITNVPEKPILLLDILGSVTYDLKIKDIDGHAWRYEISGDNEGVTHQVIKDGIEITIRPVLKEGDYKFKVKLTDELKAFSEYEIPFRIVSVKAPVIRSKIPAQMVGVKNDPIKINLSDYFEPQEYLTLEYKAKASKGSLISTTLDKNGVLTLKGFKSGKTNVSVEVSNGHKTTRTNFNVTVVNDINDDIYSIWPLPIQTDLNIWVNPKHKTVKVELLSISGEVVFEQSVTTNFSNIAKVDMKKVAPGSYTLRVEAGNNPFIKAVLKR